MRITTGIIILATTASTVLASNITYNVVSLVPSNQTLGVLVDGQLYPLTGESDSSIFHTGEAPSASSGYKYAQILKNDYSIVSQENFTRSPLTNDTLNEYYDRSWNTKTMNTIPTILSPLSVVNRIDSDLHVDGQIPTIHLTGNQTAVDEMHADSQADTKVDLNMTYISLNALKTYSSISVSISGHSTRSYAKLSYSIKIPKKQGDLFNYRRLKLRSMATDASYMRDELNYDIANSIGLPTSKCSYIRLFINDNPIGLFALAEVFKNPWIQNEFADGDSDYKQGAFFVADVSGGQNMSGGGGGNQTMGGGNQTMGGGNQTMGGGNQTMGGGNQTMGGGNQTMGGGNQTMGGGQAMGGDSSSMQGSSSDLSYLGTNISLYSAGQYKVKEDPSIGSANYTRIMDLTRFISEQINATQVDDSVVSSWQEKMDTDSALRMIAMEIVISNSDAYFTMGNNYIMYDDLDADRIVFSGQDFDLTMGTSISNATLMNSGNYTDYPNFSKRPLSVAMMKVPQFKQDLENLIYNITRDLVNTDILTPRVNSLMNLISEDVAWDKTLTRVASGSGGMGQGQFQVSSSSSNSLSIDSMTLMEGVKGSSNSTNSMALLEWLELRSNNILTFFNSTTSS
ncbi:coth protein-domain-containing protein [Gilbertella persicaria]|uniref:coth protein-domain-containing protein n=1 Tax=Gilbertella persicaria TaxID=101096 RepID=UPI00221F2167|nr:coth protein-domain-containing protein [Gilbertella persicaria]KAI8064292.1 coth protein-domain-containing protein [Gilbertella persicaria]